MHRNTFLLVLFLGIFAALVVGVNIGRGLTPSKTQQTQVSPTVNPSPSVSPPSAAATRRYTNAVCEFSLDYPNGIDLLEGATGSAMLLDRRTNTSIVMTCEKTIPRPPLPTAFIESRIINNDSKTASIAAKLYHDRSPKDGTQQDALIYRNTKINKDVFIAGFGVEFNKIISTLTLVP